jgi:hypothetical protein
VRNEAAFGRHATTATAVVLETGDPDRTPGSIDVLVVASERRHRFEVWSSEDYEVGQRVSLLVDRNDPDRMRLVGEWVNFVSTPIEVVSILGFVAVIVAIPCGLWMVVRGCRTRRRAQRGRPGPTGSAASSRAASVPSVPECDASRRPIAARMQREPPPPAVVGTRR